MEATEKDLKAKLYKKVIQQISNKMRNLIEIVQVSPELINQF